MASTSFISFHHTRSIAQRIVAAFASASIGAALLVSTNAATAAPSSPPAVLIPTTGAYFGSWVAPRGGESRADAIERVEAQTGRRFTIDHQYYRWDSNFPAGHETWTVSQGRIPFLNWKAQRQNGQAITWSSIASGAEDGAIAARADAISAFGYPLYLTFHHEPEDDLATWGTPAQYAAAFRRVVDVFRARGVTNVAFVWTMMSWTFDPRSGRDPMSYYPGDGYVDLIGSDGYNFYPGKPGVPWDPFGRVFRPTQEFAVARTKPWMAVEYGVQEDPAVPGRKGQWFIDAAAVAPTWTNLKGLIYFDEIKEYAPNSWNTDTSSSSIAGYAALGATPHLNLDLSTSPTVSPSPSPTPSPTVSPSPSPTPSPTVSPSPSPTPSPTVSPSPSPTPSPTVSPSPSPTPSPTVSPSPSPTPSPSPSPPQPPPALVNTLDGGAVGEAISVANSGGSNGSAFDAVKVGGGASLTYDAERPLRGLSARHESERGRNALYEYAGSFGSKDHWFGRVYLRLTSAPQGSLQIVRAKDGGDVNMTLEISKKGMVRARDRRGHVIVAATQPLWMRTWQRIEWSVDHQTGSVELMVFNLAEGAVPTEVVRTHSAAALGHSVSSVQFGRSGQATFQSVFWTDAPGLSDAGYLGP